jgi:L-2-hydroxyglutarate oxidase LhgO
VELDGALRLGPDVEAVEGRTFDYRVNEAHAERFLAAASRYLEGLQLDDLVPDQAGVRPKLVPPGGGVPDFLVAEESARGMPGWVNLIGIESPGLTASLEIAEYVQSLLG